MAGHETVKKSLERGVILPAELHFILNDREHGHKKEITIHNAFSYAIKCRFCATGRIADCLEDLPEIDHLSATSCVFKTVKLSKKPKNLPRFGRIRAEFRHALTNQTCGQWDVQIRITEDYDPDPIRASTYRGQRLERSEPGPRSSVKMFEILKRSSSLMSEGEVRESSGPPRSGSSGDQDDHEAEPQMSCTKAIWKSAIALILFATLFLPTEQEPSPYLPNFLRVHESYKTLIIGIGIGYILAKFW